MGWRLVQWSSATWWGGAEVRFVELCEELRQRQHFIRVVSRRPSRLWTMLQRHGFIIDGDAPRQAGHLLKILQIGLRLRRWKAQIIHAHAGRDYVPAIIAGKIANCPTVLHRHFLLPLKPLTRFLVQKWAGAIVAVSQRVAQTLINEDHLSPEKVIVIPMGVNVRRISEAAKQTDAIRRVREELAIGNRFFILSVAHLYPTKGHDVLIHAIYHLHKQGFNVFLAIAGNGTERARLQALIEQLGLQSQVRLLGYRDDIPILLHACDCFALLSWSDAFPGAVIEAMVAGKPIVACTDGGVPEIIGDYPAAILVPPRDSDTAAQAIASLLHNKSVKSSYCALKSPLNIATTVDALESLYQRLLEGD